MIVVVIYCVLSIVVILINIILVICDIDYCRYYSIYVATLYVDSGLVYCMSPEHLLCVCLHSCNQQFRSRAWFEFDWQLRNFRRVRF